MKINLIKLLIFTVILLAVSQTGLCDTATDAIATNTTEANELTLAMIKFGKVMLGVVVASITIYLLLLIWNFIINRSHKTNNEYKSTLKSPKTIDEAILFFINKTCAQNQKHKN